MDPAPKLVLWKNAPFSSLGTTISKFDPALKPLGLVPLFAILAWFHVAPPSVEYFKKIHTLSRLTEFRQLLSWVISKEKVMVSAVVLISVMARLVRVRLLAEA